MDDLLNENIPAFSKAMMVDHYVNENVFGKLMGKLKEDYQSLKKSDLFYLAYRKEMFHYQVTISHYDAHGELTPVEYKIFKTADQLKMYVRNIQEHMGEPSHSFESRPSDMIKIFDDNE